MRIIIDVWRFHMDITQVIKERRSIKRFQEKEVSLQLITELLDAAVWAPNHRLTEPWRFIIVHGDAKLKLAETARAIREANETDPEKKKVMGEKVYEKIASNPMYVIVVMKEDENPKVKEEDFAATCCLIQNFSLVAWEKEIGMTWHSYGWLQDPLFREAYGIQSNERAIANLHLGYPEIVPNGQERKSAKQLITVLD